MPLDIDRIQGICLDLDGTISNTDDRYVSILAERLSTLGKWFPVRDPQAIARKLVISLEKPVNTLYHLLDRVHLDQAIMRLTARFYNWRSLPGRPDFLLIPGVDQAIGDLAQHYPLCIVSARDQEGTMAFLEHFNLLRHFKTVITGESSRFTKPFPHPILLAAEHMQLAPRHLLMVGDTMVDIRAGKAAGAQTAGVLCGFGTEDDLRNAGADILLKSTSDLPVALFKGSDVK